eukprot:GHVL01039629.1.p1 GENE.GHVL01039629.1~~GHVL01039629.1.p1  ORF type:complete len:371 (-),score=59.59 GHVL01039629.1:43-1155(-)
MLVNGYYKRFFKEIRRLGVGSYGQVFLSSHCLDDLHLGDFAVKKVPVGDNKSWLQKVLREVKLSEKIRHTNVVEYKHSWLEISRHSQFCPWVPFLFILQHYCNGGSVEDLIWDPGEDMARHLTDFQVWKIFLDICHGLQHLHHSGIIHRDLKPSNVLLDYTVDEITKQKTCTALLSDFGTSELLNEKRGVNRQGYTGTVEYTAPELLQVDDSGRYRDDYDTRSDMWSLGVLLFSLAYGGQVPFQGQTPSECREKILGYSGKIKFPQTPKRQKEMEQLIQALMNVDGDQRPTCDDVIEHPFILQISKKIIHQLQQSPKEDITWPSNERNDIEMCDSAIRVFSASSSHDFGDSMSITAVPLEWPPIRRLKKN